MDALGIVSAFIMQIGVRHVTFDMTEAQRKLMQHPIVKGIVLFSMFYVTTRSFLIATIFTLAYFILVIVLLNETHTFNVFSRPWLIKNGFLKKEYFEDEHTSLVDRYKRNLEAVLYA
jgi:hypothetical protein